MASTTLQGSRFVILVIAGLVTAVVLSTWAANIILLGMATAAPEWLPRVRGPLAVIPFMLVGGILMAFFGAVFGAHVLVERLWTRFGSTINNAPHHPIVTLIGVGVALLLTPNVGGLLFDWPDQYGPLIYSPLMRHPAGRIQWSAAATLAATLVAVVLGALLAIANLRNALRVPIRRQAPEASPPAPPRDPPHDQRLPKETATAPDAATPTPSVQPPSVRPPAIPLSVSAEERPKPSPSIREIEDFLLLQSVSVMPPADVRNASTDEEYSDPTSVAQKLGEVIERYGRSGFVKFGLDTVIVSAEASRKYEVVYTVRRLAESHWCIRSEVLFQDW